MSWFGEEDKVRKSDWPVWDYMFGYFPKAWLEEVRVAVIGNKQHNPNQPLHWAREKSKDQKNTAMRHIFDYAKAKAQGVTVPRDAKGNSVLAQAIWRLKAQLELDLEEEAGQQNSIPVPSPVTASVRQRLCACGMMALTIQEGSLPPSIMFEGRHHMEHSCV